jgi:SAM-dependent methyltransferase
VSTFVDPAWERERDRFPGLEFLFDGATIRYRTALGVIMGWSCLEVGCGAGAVAMWLADKVGPTGRVVATDLDTRFIDGHGRTNIEARAHDILRGAPEEAAFDLVHATAVIEHIADHETALAHLLAAVRPGGWALIEAVDFGGPMAAALARYSYPPELAPTIERLCRACEAVFAAVGADASYGAQLDAYRYADLGGLSRRNCRRFAADSALHSTQRSAQGRDRSASVLLTTAIRDGSMRDRWSREIRQWWTRRRRGCHRPGGRCHPGGRARTVKHSGGPALRLCKSFRVLAYVFWHTPGAIDGIVTYEAALAAFHRSLDPAEISGFRGSQAFLVQGAMWVSSAVVYEDWYLVDDFTALGELNDAAVAGHRRRPHDDVAAMAGEGMAGIYSLRQGAAQLSDGRRAAWFDKIAGASYDEFLGRLGGRGSLWQRQMVLGPTPEFCSLDDDDPPSGAVTVTRVRKVGASAS